MFINEVFIMYNFDITSIVKCHYVPEGKLKQAQIMFLDFSYSHDELSTTQQGYPGTISPHVFTKDLKDETVKRGFLTNTDRIFEEVLDRYFELYSENILRDMLKDSKIPVLNYDVKDDTKKLIYLCLNGSRLVASECRFGPSNAIIIPDIKYEKILKTAFPDGKIVVNPTKVYKNKIFLIRVENQLSNPGLSLFVTKNIVTDRYMKLSKIMEKMGIILDDLSFSYILTNTGFNSGKFVQIVNLIDN